MVHREHDTRIDIELFRNLAHAWQAISVLESAGAESLSDARPQHV
ncbi:MAG: hypothetical protein ABI186_06950 [Candidatus Elarobacter sp.]